MSDILEKITIQSSAFRQRWPIWRVCVFKGVRACTHRHTHTKETNQYPAWNQLQDVIVLTGWT